MRRIEEEADRGGTLSGDRPSDRRGGGKKLHCNKREARSRRTSGTREGGNRSFSLSVLLASSQTDGRTDDNADMTPLNPTKKLLMVATFFFLTKEDVGGGWDRRPLSGEGKTRKLESARVDCRLSGFLMLERVRNEVDSEAMR